ncbi:MAG: VCBS repeat-containing protein [Flavobacteriales bacterium]|nr:VCBS repeat-containing protein [Flavobacteriales bacterium]
MKKIINSIIILLCLLNTLSAQINLSFYIDETGNNVVHTAKQEIKFLPGYKYVPDATGTHHSYIGGNSDFSQIYSGLPEDNFIEREINTGLPVGSIAGQHHVDLFGAATYTIPISLPIGTNGFTPTLALSYNSMGQSNVLGMGWGLSGISRISKKSLSFHYAPMDEFKVKPITESLAYELDGKHFQRSTTGSTFTFENNDFSSISYSTANSSFTVRTKDGLTYYYGISANSKKDGIFWNIDKIEDNNGNYIEYIYNTANLIEEIKYTGNTNQSLVPYNSVKFYYKDREDKNTYYYVGQQINNNKLLDYIEVLAENNLARKYRFNYSFNLYSYLYEIIESGADESDLNSTIINYKEIEKLENYIQSGIPTQNAEYRTGDFNGDGKADVLAFAFYFNSAGSKIYSHYNLYLNQGQGNFSLEISGGALPTNFYPFESLGDMSQLSLNNRGIDAVDLNGDGLEDMLLGRNYGTGFIYTPYYTVKNEITGQITFIQGADVVVNSPISSHQIILGDFNGDGKVDAFINRNLSSNDLWQLVFFSGSASANNTNILKSEYYNSAGTSTTLFNYKSFISLDYDGDGKSDLMGWQNGSSIGKIFIFDLAIGIDGQPNNSGAKLKEVFSSAPSVNFPAISTIRYLGDFNGDGKTDVLSTNGYEFSIYYCTGNGFNLVEFSNISGINHIFNNDVLYIVNDFNGDGKADIYSSNKNVSSSNNPYLYFTIHYSNGLNFSPKTYSINSSVYGEIFPSIGDFDGNGSSDVLFHSINLYDNQIPMPIYFSLTDARKSLAKTIKNGFNNEVSFYYEPLTNGLGTTVYEKFNGAVYPINDAQFPLHVVSSVATSDGIGGTNTTNYFYKGAILHKTGKGFLGFSEISSVNNNLKLKTVTEFELFHAIFPAFFTTYRTPGFMTKTQKKYLSTTNTLLESSTFTNQIIGGVLNYQKQVTKAVVHDYLTDVITTSDYTYDTGGNPETITTTINNVETSLTTNTFQSIANWGPKNKLTSSTTSVTRLNEPPYTRSVNFTYDATKGSLETKTEDNGLFTAYEHTNGLGNVTKSTLSGGGITTRSTTFIYDAKGRFVEETINPLNQHSYATYDARWGVPLTQTGVDGLITTYQYDEFGRLESVTTPDNITTTSTLAWEVGGGSATNPLTADNSIYTVTITTEGSPTQKTWYDSFARARKTEVDGFDKKIYQVTTYDNRGNVATTTTPFFATDEPLVTAYTYNDLNLANTIVSEIGTTSFDYVYSTGDHTTTITQTLPDGNSATSITDATGKLIKAIDNGGTLDYTYYSSGLQKDIKLNTVLAASMEYDDYGKQTKLIDPNAGTTEYIYDAIGQLTYQKDAKNNEYTMTYDALGRLATKTENGTSFGFTYYTNGNGINQPENITYNGITQHFTYDYLGRLTETKETFEGEEYIFGYQYDNYNRVEQSTYPSGFKTKHHYNSFSYPTTVTDEQATTTYWQAGSMNAYNQYKTYTLGNGQTTTKTYDDYGLPTEITTTNPNIQNLLLNFNPQNGNLISRANPNKNLLEEFKYDNLNRLTETKVNGVVQQTMQYQSNGNIGFKTDAGNYSYDVNRKNAVTQVSNQQSNISSNVQDITYNAFNSVNTIIENNNELTFTYGSDQQRRKMEHKIGGNTQKTTYYFGNYEKIIDETTGDQTELHYIGGGDGLAAIYVAVTPPSGETEGATYYTYTDHLGSILTLTNNVGDKVFETNFDAWGRTRNVDDWTYDNAEPFVETGYESISTWLTRGYTGHEHLTEFGLINMNGRLYDPILGRMLSPDNYVQDATSTQGYNRYSYVINNPLKYTDPDGEWIHIAIGAVVGGIINTVANWDNIDNIGEGLAVFGAGAGGGALTMLNPVLGGMAGGALTGSVNAWAAGGDKNAIIQGGLVGGFAGLAGGAVGKWAAQSLGGLVINGFNITSPVIKGVVGGTIGGAVGGYAGGFTGGYLTTGDFDMANRMGLNGLYSGAAIGGVAGGIGAYSTARKNDINPWNGTPKNSVTIGQGQKGRVNPVAESLGTKTINDDPSIPDLNNTPLNEALDLNNSWINERVTNGDYIFDLGRNPQWNFDSRFYRIEQINIQNYQNVIPTNYYQLGPIKIIKY